MATDITVGLQCRLRGARPRIPCVACGARASAPPPPPGAAAAACPAAAELSEPAASASAPAAASVGARLPHCPCTCACSGRLPQAAHWRQKWVLPGTDWRISGHSRALERTGFVLESGSRMRGRICLDAGVDFEDPSCAPPRAVLLTHTHIDHANALPMLFRHKIICPDAPPAPIPVLVPSRTMRRLREFCQLSWAMKVEEGADLPAQYAPPAPLPPDTPPGAAVEDLPYRVWRPVVGGLEIPLALTPRSQTKLLVRTVDLHHTVQTVGYVIAERRMKLREELRGADSAETAARVRAARARGEEVSAPRALPLLAYLCDTTTAVFADRASAEAIFRCPVVMIECTFLQDEWGAEARRRGHVAWGALRPHVLRNLASPTRAPDGTPLPPVTWVLFHFSLRYSDAGIADFFLVHAGVPLVSAGNGRPNIVLWLDSAVVELWIPPGVGFEGDGGGDGDGDGAAGGEAGAEEGEGAGGEGGVPAVGGGGGVGGGGEGGG